MSENPVVEAKPSKSSSSHTSKTLKTNSENKREKETQKNNQTSKNENQEGSSSSSASMKSEQTNLEPKAIATDWTKLSAPGDDPQFFEFVVRKAAKFENPIPVDVQCVAEAWIRKQGHVLYPEYLEWQEGLRSAETRQVHPEIAPPPVEAEMTEAERRANALARLQMKYKVPKFREEAIAECQQWGFVIGKNGPQDLT
jgi:hypothetical protein